VALSFWPVHFRNVLPGPADTGAAVPESGIIVLPASAGRSFGGAALQVGTSLSRTVVSGGCVLALLCVPAFAVSRKSSNDSAVKQAGFRSSSDKHKKSRKKTSSRRGQQKIDAQRARSIQEALIREHYLNGEPSGVWDGKSQKAMERFQSDNGWQTKVIPDSRALIKLGLGPDQQHLLNPESAMTAEAQAARSAGTPTGTVTPATNSEPASTTPPQ